ncbi:diguanylate cyclase (GGDEF)-like protein [Sphingomonas naasensis]|uniref:EAL domain-containing protein n=1 Tax=Sphingomonas naasensis TaxID=1344951 RepID=A0A4S1WRG8_9SPHN|nr:EAL domain-containing protein [Sphingomonas naasensis]NIJ18736.1 diguanylate cyclase (GGDEF)-like protein [Sphingomonas naasensis]TGX45971.1 EAL domain-containing protein [Sphingomonas naasensis]
MFRRPLPAVVTSSEQDRAILVEQFRTLRQQVPLMYALMLVDAAFLSFASNGTVSAWWSFGMPVVLAVLGAIRAAFWLRRRSFTPEPDAIARYLLGTTIVAAVLSIGFGGWGLFLYFQADLVRRACIALYIFIGAISCCYCLQSLPRAGHAVLFFGAMPVTVCLLFSGDWILRGVGFNIVVVAALILRMLRTTHAGFIEVLRSRSDMAAEQRRARGAEQRAHQLAYHDPLTGLPNRRALTETLEARVASAASGERFGLLIVDLDHFKSVNDVHGHPAGDVLLREVAARLTAAVGEAGKSFRLGGDEFAVIVDGDGEEARRGAQVIVQAMQRAFAGSDLVHHIGASIGISLYPGDAHDLETLMRRADIALYKAKQSGRSQHCAFEPTLDAEIRRRAELEREMRDAMARDAFVPHYQAIVDLKQGSVVGYELLARWQRPGGEEIGPELFIPIAEECGLIDELMLRLLRRACRETRDWNAAIAINVSPTQLKDPWFSQKVLAVLTRERFPPPRLTIEITENALIVDADRARQTIASLRNQGIQLALDDFGTGYSSLQHLQMLPFDRLKIDRSFVTAMERDPEALRLVHAIITLANTLGLPVVAEGIESASTARTLVGLGCAMGQGFHFGYPMSRDDVEAHAARVQPA